MSSSKFVLALLIGIQSSVARSAERATSTIGAEGPAAAEWNEINWRSLGQDAVAPLNLSVSSDGAIILGGGVLLTVLSLAYESSSDQHFQKWMSTHHPLGETSRVGDLWGQAVPNVLYFAGMLAAAPFSDSSQSEKRTLKRAHLMFEATLWASVFSTVLKYATHEERPDHSSRDSFPSGHATTSFAFASIVAQEHAWYWGSLAYAAAAFSGVSRVNDNRHYLHDVIAGGALGTAFGVAVWQTFKYRDAHVKKESLASDTGRRDEGGVMSETREQPLGSFDLGLAPLDGHGYLVTAGFQF